MARADAPQSRGLGVRQISLTRKDQDRCPQRPLAAGSLATACRAWDCWPGWAVRRRRLKRRTTPPKTAGSGSDSARTLTERGVAFLRPRQDAKGGWSTQREPGITALVVTALLRSGQVAPGDPVVTRALAYLEGFIGPKGGLSEAPHANYSTSIAILAFQEANVNGRYDRTIKAGQGFLKTMQWDESEGKTRRRRLLRRRGLRRLQQPARLVEHRILHRSLARDRLARRRSQPAKSDHLRVALPELQERVQRPSRGRPRSTTVGSSTRPPMVGRAWPAAHPAADFAPMPA